MWATATFPPRTVLSTNDPQNEVLRELIKSAEGRSWPCHTRSLSADYIIDTTRGPTPTIAGPTPDSPPPNSSPPHNTPDDSPPLSCRAASDSDNSEAAAPMAEPEPAEYETLTAPSLHPIEPLPPFLRMLPAEVRVLVYPYLWHITRCPKMFAHAGGSAVWVSRPPHREADASWLRDARVSWSIGTTFHNWVAYPSVVLKMDERIQAEFVGELLKAFPMHVHFSREVAGELGRLRWLPMPPAVFVENVRELRVDVCWSGGADAAVVGGGLAAEDPLVRRWERRFEQARSRVGNCLRASRLLEDVKIAFEVDVAEHPSIVTRLPGYLRKVCGNGRVQEIDVGMYVQESRYARHIFRYEGGRDLKLCPAHEQSEWERWVEDEVPEELHDPETCDEAVCKDIRRKEVQEMARKDRWIQRGKLMNTYFQGCRAYEKQQEQKLQEELLAPRKRKIPLDFTNTLAPGRSPTRKFRGEYQTIRYYSIPVDSLGFTQFQMGWPYPNLDGSRKIAKHRMPRRKSSYQPALEVRPQGPSAESKEPGRAEKKSDPHYDSANEEDQDALYSKKIGEYNRMISREGAKWRKETAMRERSMGKLQGEPPETTKSNLAPGDEVQGLIRREKQLDHIQLSRQEAGTANIRFHDPSLNKLADANARLFSAVRNITAGIRLDRQKNPRGIPKRKQPITTPTTSTNLPDGTPAQHLSKPRSNSITTRPPPTPTPTQPPARPPTSGSALPPQRLQTLLLHAQYTLSRWALASSSPLITLSIPTLSAAPLQLLVGGALGMVDPKLLVCRLQARLLPLARVGPAYAYGGVRPADEFVGCARAGRSVWGSVMLLLGAVVLEGYVLAILGLVGLFFGVDWE